MPPLRELTPETSYGFAVIEFAQDVLGVPLDPWQEWLVIHAGELLPDMRPRFRKVLVVVARQQGKTHLLKVLTNFWLFVEQWPMILGQSTGLGMAKEAWEGAQEMAQAAPPLAAEFGHTLKGNNNPHWKTKFGSTYKIAAATRRGGRGASVDRLVVDELREHQTWLAYNAAMPTMNARPYAQAWLITNQGDDNSVVLNSLRDAGISAVEGRPIDQELALFEWSAPLGSDPEDPEALAMSCPNLGRRVSLPSLLADARRAKKGGGEELAGFLTEILCIRVPRLDAAIDAAAWKLAAVPGSILPLRASMAAVADVSYDERHASLVLAAPMPDGRIRIEQAGAWTSDPKLGPASTQMEAALPDLLARIKPRVFARIPGPSDSVSAGLDEVKGRKQWQPRGVRLVKITGGEVTGLCMAFAAMVSAGNIVHPGQPLLTDHVIGAEKLHQGDVWRFSRKGAGHCDAAYAAAGAVKLARTLPANPGRMRVVTAASATADE